MSKRRNFDSPWKEAITQFFRPFLEFFFADIAREVDWSHPVEFLESELRQLMDNEEIGRRTVDVLVRVHRLDGTQSRVMIHVEVQSQRVEHFEERIWVSHSRIRQRHGGPVCCLAILGDESRPWRPDCFQEELWGCEVRLRFRSVKLLDFEYLLEFPSLDDNHFTHSLFVTAHLAAQRASHDSAKRRIYKYRLFRELLESGCDSETIQAFLRLLDCLLALSARHDTLFWGELKATLPEDKMQFVTSFERRGRREGREEGRREGREEGRREGREEGRKEGREQGCQDGEVRAYCASISALLQARFGAVPAELRERVAGIQKSEKLANLVTLAGTADSLEQFGRECGSQ